VVVAVALVVLVVYPVVLVVLVVQDSYFPVLLTTE
jgi:hypothetical protein|tara:strand:+ start:513 stop:617 length:105 start_codon:yes stop_codon:yes gene_type:complete